VLGSTTPNQRKLWKKLGPILVITGQEDFFTNWNVITGSV
jgi:hypothetical protein